MKNPRNCLYCGVKFDAKRADHFFCSAKHVAAYYRDNPNPDYIHAEKEREHTYYCERCGVPFQVNDYAKREGQRTPKYHSNACKQAAYRERGKFTQEQAARRPPKQGKAGDNAKSGSAGGNSGQNAGNSPPSGKNGQSKKRPNFWDGYKDKWRAAQAILNVQDGVTAAQLRRAWMKLLKQYHPDVNPSPDATHEAQKINWAYEYLTKV